MLLLECLSITGFIGFVLWYCWKIEDNFRQRKMRELVGSVWGPCSVKLVSYGWYVQLAEMRKKEGRRFLEKYSNMLIRKEKLNAKRKRKNKQP